MSTDPTQQSGGEQPYYEYGPQGNPQDPYGSQYSQPLGNPQDSYTPPPPPDYAYAAYGYGYGQQGQQTGPLPLGEAIGQLPGQYWKVLSKPGAATFAEEAGKAEWGIILIQLFGVAIIGAILSIFARATSAAGTAALLNQLNANPGTSTTTTQTTTLTLSPAVSFFISLAITLVFFFVAQGIYFGLAKAFGGQGSFTAQAYSTLLYQTPIGILGGLLGLIPILGGLGALALDIYGIVLAVFMVMGVHRLSGGKASAVILIPLGVVFLLVCILAIAAFALLAAAIRSAQP
ncbi:MAG TPA: Yip1 family protein [Ktedonobacterales bacterium]